MTPAQRSWIQVAVTTLIMWSAVRVLARFVPEPALWLLVVLAAMVVVITWMLRYTPHQLLRFYQFRGSKHLIDFVCKITRIQPPVSERRFRKSKETHDVELKSDPYLLRSREAFAVASQKLKNIVRGHDKEIDSITRTLANCMLLREKRTEATGLPPLAIFLFVGRDGSGKRFLARKLANLLYRRRSIVDLDLAKSIEGSICTHVFGNASIDGLLTTTVRRTPHTMVVLQNIERAPADFMNYLEAIFSRGTLVDPVSNAPVSFQHCVFVLTTAQCREQLTNVRERVEGKRNWLARANEVLSTDTPLTVNLLGFVNDVLLFGDLNALEKAEVISLLMRKECRRYDLKLEYVEPEILMEQVALINNEVGFSTAPARISRLLHDPLVRASQDGHTSLVLRGNQITLVPDLEAEEQ